MDPAFWHERWRSGQIGFHQTAADRNLVRHWPQLGLAAGSSVFVPLCGKSLDLIWLRDRGHRVIGVELSGIAIEAFCMENGLPSKRRRVGGFEVYEAPNIELYCGDFFALTHELLGPVAGVYDRAAAISWAPPLRAGYVAHLTSLLRAGTGDVADRAGIPALADVRPAVFAGHGGGRTPLLARVRAARAGPRGYPGERAAPARPRAHAARRGGLSAAPPRMHLRRVRTLTR